MADRSCTVPAGKAIFFPLFNVIFWAPEDAEFLRSVGLEGTDAELLKIGANAFTDAATSLTCTVDGVPLRDLFAYRAESPRTFTSVFGEGVFGFGDGAVRTTFSDGFWLMLPPLSRGEHEITFSSAGKCTAEACFGIEFEFGPDPPVIYHLTVE